MWPTSWLVLSGADTFDVIPNIWLSLLIPACGDCACRSQLAANTLAACQFSGYKLFSPWVSSMEKRAMLSQGSNAMSAEHVCKDVSKVIDRWKVRGRSPPLWFFVGGKSLYYWVLGVLQKTLTLMMSASMVDHLLMNQYDLSHDTKKP